MARYSQSVNFIQACENEDPEVRIQKIASNMKLAPSLLKVHEEKILRISEFVSSAHERYHDANPDKKNETRIFFDATFHNHIGSDLRALMYLGVTNHGYQANIILRHLLDIFLITLWADLCCECSGGFYYFANTKRWHPYREVQQISWELDKKHQNRSMKERLEAIKIRNSIRGDSIQFYRRYLRTACACELRLLLSLPICDECLAKKRKELSYEASYNNNKRLKRGLEAEHARYKSNITSVCAFCDKQKRTRHIALGVPDSDDMAKMLKVVITDDRLIINLSRLQKLYNHLSGDFVHFSTTYLPSSRPKSHDFDGAKGTIWGLDGVLFLIEILNPLMDYYFKILKHASSNPNRYLATVH